MATFSFTTGPTQVPDIGELSYNGCKFSPLFTSQVSGVVIKDDAQRTTKYMEYTITVDGYVTRPSNAVPANSGINFQMGVLQLLLTAQGGNLNYTGRGFDIIVNPPGGVTNIGTTDVAWGPVPELLEFQPLGGGLSAKVRWQVKVRVSPLVHSAQASIVPLLQFNYETSVTYDEDGYSSISMSGTMEIPMTRPTQATRTLAYTVDSFRVEVENRVMLGIDLAKFRIVRRNFNTSRDKRTLVWDVMLEEKSYMDLPSDCTMARGSYSVRPAKAGLGLSNWTCTLRATYTVRKDRPRRTAWMAFLALLRLRMTASEVQNGIPAMNGANQNPVQPPPQNPPPPPPVLNNAGGFNIFPQVLNNQNQLVARSRRAFLIDFSFDEGLYLDSKTTSFSASWKMAVEFGYVLLASGLWKKLPERDAQGANLWAASMRAPVPGSATGIMGAQSWLKNRLDPALDVIVDFGGD